jgi:flavodoxin
VKTLIVYFSLDGNCALAARALEKAIASTGAVQSLRLELAKPPRVKGFLKILWGISLASSKRPPKLKPYAMNLADYDTIVIGTPVWAGGPTPVIKNFLAEHPFSEKKVAFFACHAGGLGKTFEALKALVEGNGQNSRNTIAGSIDFANAMKLGEEETAKRCGEWWAKLAL